MIALGGFPSHFLIKRLKLLEEETAGLSSWSRI